MTERPDDSGGPRLDLRALDIADNRTRADAVMRAVLEQITARRSQPEWLAWMPRAQRSLAAAAAILLLLAGAVVLAEGRGNPGADVADLMATWASSGHVPTNGELLAAYQGYRQ